MRMLFTPVFLAKKSDASFEFENSPFLLLFFTSNARLTSKPADAINKENASTIYKKTKMRQHQYHGGAFPSRRQKPTIRNQLILFVTEAQGHLCNNTVTVTFFWPVKNAKGTQYFPLKNRNKSFFLRHRNKVRVTSFKSSNVHGEELAAHGFGQPDPHHRIERHSKMDIPHLVKSI